MGAEDLSKANEPHIVAHAKMKIVMHRSPAFFQPATGATLSNSLWPNSGPGIPEQCHPKDKVHEINVDALPCMGLFGIQTNNEAISEQMWISTLQKSLLLPASCLAAKQLQACANGSASCGTVFFEKCAMPS